MEYTILKLNVGGPPTLAPMWVCPCLKGSSELLMCLNSQSLPLFFDCIVLDYLLHMWIILELNFLPLFQVFSLTFSEADRLPWTYIWDSCFNIFTGTASVDLPYGACSLLHSSRTPLSYVKQETITI